jgi:hypothetical protein
VPRQKKPWFRLYVEMVRDAKLRRLTPAQRWLWVVVLAAARESPEPGWLWLAEGEHLTTDDLAQAAGTRHRETADGLAVMERLGMLTSTDTGWFVTGWWDRQYESDTRAHR